MKMRILPWFEREFSFGIRKEMLPFYLERLAGTIVRIENKVKDIPDKKLSTKVNGKWSVKENIAHLAEVDEISTKRIDQMKAGISPLSPAVIQPGRDYNIQSIEEVATYFKNNRIRNIEKYNTLHEEDLDRSSLHPRLKVQLTPVDL